MSHGEKNCFGFFALCFASFSSVFLDPSPSSDSTKMLKKVKQYSLNKYWKLKANDEHEVLEHATPNEELDEGTSTNQEEKSEPDQNVEITQSKPVKKDTEGETFDKSFDLRKHVISKKKMCRGKILWRFGGQSSWRGSTSFWFSR